MPHLSREQIRRRRFRDKIRQLKQGRQCVVCGETRVVCLDFHHRDPTTKLFKISSSRRLGKSWSAVLQEIEKCDTMCANCHRLEHELEYCAATQD